MLGRNERCPDKTPYTEVFTFAQLNRSPAWQAVASLPLMCCQERYPERSIPQMAESNTLILCFRKDKAIAPIQPKKTGHRTAKIAPNSEESVELSSEAKSSEGLVATIKSATNIHLRCFFFEMMSFVIVFPPFTHTYFYFYDGTMKINT